MARYREKDETDLRWNKIRRRLTRELDTQLHDWREDALNKILSHAWSEYAKSLERGDAIEIEPDYEAWVGRALDQTVALPMPTVDGVRAA